MRLGVRSDAAPLVAAFTGTSNLASRCYLIHSMRLSKILPTSDKERMRLQEFFHISHLLFALG